MPRGAAILVIRGPFRLPQSTSNRGAQSNTTLMLINVSTRKLRRAVRLPRRLARDFKRYARSAARAFVIPCEGATLAGRGHP